ncbi:hypothetical protein NIE88_02140 [Sporolactobacillus shoreicorticis]|uniref:Uncharacterized protein n=1 Tax=Sporolactobacillus shoreicorticis TaxID=1923877 RepID=A0ABW5S0D3_9BACL|nr:hypothetical protein [Sporolactobacillus shoreicorticis]MCO7124579.1 hypothetical protein [Sporolactobacillus shoreicorticis]
MEISNSSTIQFLKKIGLYVLIGFTGMFLIPIFAVVTVGFTLCAAIAIIGGLLRTFGAEWVSMDLSFYYEIPRAFSLIAAILLSSILLCIAWLCSIGLRKYLGWAGAQLRNSRIIRK